MTNLLSDSLVACTWDNWLDDVDGSVFVSDAVCVEPLNSSEALVLLHSSAFWPCSIGCFWAQQNWIIHTMARMHSISSLVQFTWLSPDVCRAGAELTASVCIAVFGVRPRELGNSFWPTEKNGSVDTDDAIERPLSEAEPPPLSSEVHKTNTYISHVLNVRWQKKSYGYFTSLFDFIHISVRHLFVGLNVGRVNQVRQFI